MNATVPFTILVVDDSAAQRRFVELLLGAEGYQVDSAQNGAEALEYLRDSTPNAVILDIAMPGIDGLEVCRRIRQYPHLQDLPVIILTAHKEPDMHRRASELRATLLVTKPLLGKGFRQLIADVLEPKTQAAPFAIY